MVVVLVGCHFRLSGDNTPSEAPDQKARMDERVLALKSHLAEQERVEASRRRGPVTPQVRLPPVQSGQPMVAPQPEGIAAYREHIALLGEKQMLVDMQVVLSDMTGRPGEGAAKARLADMDAQLGVLEGAQRERDRALGIEQPRDRR